MSDKCPVCNTEIPKPESSLNGTGGGRRESFSCPRCGDFTLDWFVLRPDDLRDKILKGDIIKIAKLSHWVRTRHESLVKEPPDDQFYRKAVILDEKLVESIVQNPRPSLAEQADNFVRWLGDNTQSGGDCVRCNMLAIEAIVGSATPRELLLVFNHLKAQGIITGDRELDKASPAGFTQIAATLSFPGWEYYHRLKRAAHDSRKAFMAMKYGDKQLDELVENMLKPAVKQTGFDLFRLVDRPKAGLIDNRLRVEIQSSRFLIADLTHENAGAYWEAGYAEGLGKPVIYTCEKTKFETCKTHFDTNHHLTLQWAPDGSTDIAEELKATIRATLPGETEMPVEEND